MEKAFPPDFIFGTAISAFQTEMGVSKESVFEGTDWYVWANSEELARKGVVSGDRPQDGPGFWDKYEEDFENARELGTDAIRMSIEWARIFPEDTSRVDAHFERNDKGEPIGFSITRRALAELEALADGYAVEHYREMLRAAARAGLKVFLTLYHWPLPIWLHEPLECHRDIARCRRRGWLDGKTVEEFAKYAAFAREKFNEYVYCWETINEPEVIAVSGYLLGEASGFPPALSDPVLTYRVERNLAFAHNLAYRELKKGGREVGIGGAPIYFEPADSDPRTLEVAERVRYLYNEWILNAAVLGEFDNDLDGKPDEKIEGFGGSDYVGINYYMRARVRYSGKNLLGGVLPVEFEECTDCTDFGWDIYPEGLREVAKWVYRRFRRPIYVLENGIADHRDVKRGDYIKRHLCVLSDTINVEGIPVKGYFHWSLFDNFEWAKGYSMRFGLYEVDYKTKQRKMRKSAEVYAKICKTKRVEDC